MTLPRNSTQWKELALEAGAVAIGFAVCGGMFGLGFVVVKRLASCFLGGL